MNILYSTHTSPQYMPPLELSERQIVVSPHYPSRLEGGRIRSIKIAPGRYDIGALVASLPSDQIPDLTVVLADAFQQCVPETLAAVPGRKLLLLADTHHGHHPLQKMLSYARQVSAMEHAPIQGADDAGQEARGVILVVEDDERVRRLTVSRLKKIGYEVLEARDGPEAVNVLEGGAPVDLVFTDMIMPGGMTGREVVKAARELKPGIKVLVTTGYAEDLARGEELDRESLRVLRKPYRLADLVAALRDVIAESVS